MFSLVLGGTSVWTLYVSANDPAIRLTFTTFINYAIIYTLLLEPTTPQNIAIDGLSGAMPPALGWAAVTSSVPAETWTLVLIIFIRMSPHFWALVLYCHINYTKSGLPMLPVTHGEKYVLLYILLYMLIMIAAAILPFVYGMDGCIYLVTVLVLDFGFLSHT